VTALTTREPARTNPREAQSAGSRQLLNATISALTTLAVVLVGAVAAELGHKDYPASALLALFLIPFINPLVHFPTRGRR
jgi:hypothetical protein